MENIFKNDEANFIQMLNNVEADYITNPFGILINPDGTIERKYPKNGKDFKGEELNSFVDGHIEIVCLNTNEYMVVNENGKLNNLRLNPEATKTFKKSFETNDYIVGNAFICSKNMIQ